MGAHLKNQNWTCYYEDSSLALGFLGTIYNESLNNNLSSKSIRLAHILADIYNKKGAETLCNLNGHYLIAVNDKIKNKFYLINDRYGFKKCYYWLNNNKLIFSSNYKHICNHPDFKGHIDEQSLADFLYLGFVLEDRTFFKEIKLLPAASVLTLKNGTLSINKYWDYSFHQRSRQQNSEAEYLEEFYQKFQKAVERRIRSKSDLILPISGGLDSRTIAGMISRAGFSGKVHTFSYGHNYCYDVVYGKKIAKALGYQHTFLPISTDYLARYAEKFVSLTGGTINCLNSHMMLFLDVFQEHESLNVITGFLGDVLTGTNFNEKWMKMNEDEIILKTFEIPVEHLNDLKYCLNKDLYERIINVTIPTIKKYFHRINADDLFYKAHYLTLSQRQRRYVTFNIFCFEPLGTVLSPFTDNDFVDFILDIPKEHLMEQNLYKKMIVKYFPEVASVPWNRTKLPLNASRLRKGLRWRWERLNRNQFARATIGRKHAKMNDNYLNTAETIRTGSRDFVIRNIKDNPFLSEYFNMDRVHQMLEDHMSGKADEYSKITMLLTLSLWHKLFIEGKV